jgi:hypothetical protein
LVRASSCEANERSKIDASGADEQKSHHAMPDTEGGGLGQVYLCEIDVRPDRKESNATAANLMQELDFRNNDNSKCAMLGIDTSKSSRVEFRNADGMPGWKKSEIRMKKPRQARPCANRGLPICTWSKIGAIASIRLRPNNGNNGLGQLNPLDNVELPITLKPRTSVANSKYATARSDTEGLTWETLHTITASPERIKPLEDGSMLKCTPSSVNIKMPRRVQLAANSEAPLRVSICKVEAASAWVKSKTTKTGLLHAALCNARLKPR